MTLQRMDNVLIVVEDLEAAKAFFTELGMELDVVPCGGDGDYLDQQREQWTDGEVARVAPDGSALSPFHPWNKATVPRPEARSWKERYSWGTAPRWDRLAMEAGPIARHWVTAQAGLVNTRFIGSGGASCASSPRSMASVTSS